MKPLSRRLTYRFGAYHWFALLFAALLLTACRPVQPAALQTDDAVSSTATIPEVLIEVNASEIIVPADFPGGIVAVTVKNNTSQDLDVSFTRLLEGASAEELIELGDDFFGNLGPIMQKASFLFSFNPLPAGASDEVIIDFKTGDSYVDATEHSEEGPIPGASYIYNTFTASEIVGSVEPQADVTVEMDDFAFIMPDEVAAGEQLWQYSNVGGQWHMIFGVIPIGDATVEDVFAALQEEGEPSGPPPFEFINDMGSPPIGAGERVWVEHDIAPGTYVMACPLPDVAAMEDGGEPMSHMAHGMHRVLTVTGDSAETPASAPNQVTITALDFAFEMPSEIPAGWTAITFTNEGATNHHGYAMRLLEGVTLDQVTEAMAADGEEPAEGEEAPMLNDLAFFLPDTDPGMSNQATVELAPGNWVLVSFSLDSAGSDGPPMPDWARGSIQEFTVTEAGEAVAAPEADLTVTIGADDFDMPAEVAAGEQNVQVVNNSGADDGYIFFVKLGGDTTMEDVLASFEALFSGQEIEKMPIISTVGGLMGYNLGESYYTTINFEPGNYTAVSSINGEEFPYAGLYKNFTVK